MNLISFLHVINVSIYDFLIEKLLIKLTKGIVELKGGKYGAYKDDEGTLHILDIVLMLDVN